MLKFFGRKKPEKIPRECLREYFEEPPRACPRCGGRLANERETYLVTDGRFPYIVGSDIGWFCLACPTVVIDMNQVKELLDVAYGSPDCAPVGIIDMDNPTGQPEDEIIRDDYGEPIGKLVPFLYEGKPLRKIERTQKRARGQKKSKNRKRRG